MKKINIYPENDFFVEDLAAQIRLFDNTLEVSTDKPDSDTALYLINEDEKEVERTAEKYKDLPIVLFSSTKDMAEHADIVITKPFKLYDFLTNLKENKLLPKVRRKECINFKEYSFYPVKKEIFSAKTEKTTKLTDKEIDILKYLYQIAPEIASKEELLENVWEYSPDATTHTVETHIYRLRQKVEKDGSSQLIITENNGYKLNT